MVRLEFPARPEYLALARMVAAAVAAVDPLLDEERINDLRVVISEACTNAIEAHPRGENPGTVSLECRLTAARLEIEVSDEGSGFSVEDLAGPPAASDPARLHHERGLGIPLIRALTDEVEFLSGGGGTTVRIALYVPVPAPPTGP